MNLRKKFIAAGTVFGVAVAGLAFSAPAANAEPVTNSFAIVGSDTLQDVVNGLINGTNISGASVRSTANGSLAGSFDATGSVSIQTKSGGARFGRPNGSGDGVKALSRSIDGQPYTSGTVGGPANVTITDQVDIARSSSGATEVTNGPLLYIPFGRDALAYAYTGGTANWANINQATLKGIFEGTITSVDGVAITPVIPQAGSGTRKDWIAKIGSSEGALKTGILIGQEHDTSHLEDGSAFPNNAITPISAAQWVAQSTGAGIDRRGSGVKLGSPTGVAPVNGSGASAEPNPTYYANTTWGRDTYLVVENARVTVGDPKYSADLTNLVSTAASKLGNTQSTLSSQAGSVKKKFGFLAPASTTRFRAALQ